MAKIDSASEAIVQLESAASFAVQAARRMKRGQCAQARTFETNAQRAYGKALAFLEVASAESASAERQAQKQIGKTVRALGIMSRASDHCTYSPRRR